MFDSSLTHIETPLQDVVEPQHSVQLRVELSQLLNRHFLHGASRKLPAAHRLWSEGDRRAQVYCVRSGALSFSRMLPDGRRVVIGFAYPGDIVGLGSEVHAFDADAIQLTKLDAMSIGAVHQAVSADPAFARLVQAEVSHALSSAYGHVIVVSKLTATERLAHFLVELSERNRRRGNSPSSVLLPMRRADIADYLGLTIETISRTFTTFRKAGLIAMDEPSVVFLTGLRRLLVLASGNGDADQPVESLRLAA